MGKQQSKKKGSYNPAPPKISGYDYGTRQRGAGVGANTHRTSGVSRAFTGAARPKPGRTGLQRRTK